MNTTVLSKIPNSLFYVYMYLNPLKPGKYKYKINNKLYKFNYEPLYVGKGMHNRYILHLYNALNHQNSSPHHEAYIRKIIEVVFKTKLIKSDISYNSSTTPAEYINYFMDRVVILHETNNEDDAYDFEHSVMKHIGVRFNKTGPLTNLVYGDNHKHLNEQNKGILIFDIIKQKPRIVYNISRFNHKYNCNIKALFDNSSVTGSRFCKYEDRHSYIGIPKFIYMYDNKPHKIWYNEINKFVKNYNNTTKYSKIYNKGIIKFFNNVKVSTLERVGDLFYNKEKAKEYYKTMIMYDIDLNTYLLSYSNRQYYIDNYGISIDSITAILTGKNKIINNTFYSDFNTAYDNGQIHIMYGDDIIYYFRKHDYLEKCKEYGFGSERIYQLILKNNLCNVTDGVFVNKKDAIEFYRYVNLYSDYTDKKYTTRLCDIDKFIEEHNVDLNNNGYTYDITKYKRDIKKVIRGKVKYAYGLSLV